MHVGRVERENYLDYAGIVDFIVSGTGFAEF